ncbi:MAG: hypothetical protein WCT32_03480 [Patescibacteria group bacterium]|jgi:hypothetical protein
MHIGMENILLFSSPTPEELTEMLVPDQIVLMHMMAHREYVALLTLDRVEPGACFFQEKNGYLYPYNFKNSDGRIPIDRIMHIASIGKRVFTTLEYKTWYGIPYTVRRASGPEAFGVYGTIRCFATEVARFTGLKRPLVLAQLKTLPESA